MNTVSMNNKPLQNKKIPQAIEKAIAKVGDGIAMLKNKPFYTEAGCTKQSILEQTMIALTLSHKVLDLTTDEQGNMFYQSNLSAHVDSIIGHLNEVMVLDIDRTKKQVFQMWMVRHAMATGVMYPWDYVNTFHNFMPDPDVNAVRELIDGMGN